MQKVIYFGLLVKTGTNVGKNTTKNLTCKNSQKLLHQAKQSATDALKLAARRAIQKTAEATGDLNCNKIAHKVSKVSLKNFAAE